MLGAHRDALVDSGQSTASYQKMLMDGRI